MIEMSLFHGHGVWLLAASLSFGATGCMSAHECTEMGCLDGLHISLEAGQFDAGTEAYEIEIDEVTLAQERVPVVTCLFTPSSSDRELSCSSSRMHSEFGRNIQIPEPLKKILVVVSRGGVKISEETFEPVYSSREINGPGCGVCTQASISVTIP